MLFAQTSPWTTPPSLPNLHTLSLRFYWWLLKLFTAWSQIIFANWSAEGNQLDIPSDPAKKLCLRFQAASRYSQHLVAEHSVMRPQSSGTTYLAKYPALTLCQVLNAFWKHIFWNKLLICSGVFVSFIVLFITSCSFISFLNLSNSCKFYSFLVFLFNLL